jgi:hypothetical protein
MFMLTFQREGRARLELVEAQGALHHNNAPQSGITRIMMNGMEWRRALSCLFFCSKPLKSAYLLPEKYSARGGAHMRAKVA